MAIGALDAGHFAWEQAPEEYGRLVADSVTGGYRRVMVGWPGSRTTRGSHGAAR
jgi:hypothetical protein